jgi:hypothetical protein
MPKTPAELLAYLSGDVDNYAIATEDHGIEKQEARGQQNLIRSEILPKKLMHSHDSKELIYKTLGIVILGEADDLFDKVKLPDGWTKKPTDHNMWSELFDEKGRKRASIFYKAAYYDRSAHMGFNNRYTSYYERFGDHDIDSSEKKMFVATIKKDGVEIWRSEEPMGYSEVHEYAKKVLHEKYPKADSELAYWDED